MKKPKKQEKPVLHIVSIDAGNGGTNAVLATEEGYKSVYFPSVRAAATGDSLGLGAGMEMQFEYVDWGKSRYVVGDEALTVSRRAIERHTGSNRYGNEFHLFLIATACGKLLPSGGSIDLTLFAPPSMYVDAKATIEKRLSELGNSLAISFKGDAQPRVYRIERLTVHPEGLGAMACWILSDKGELVQGDLLAGEMVILDLGMHTADALQISNGNFNPESLASATWENAGIKDHILIPVLNMVKKKGSDFELLTIDDIDRVLRKGVITGDYSLTSGASKIELKPAFDKQNERYAQYIGNTLIDGIFNGLRGIKGLICVGGGAVLTVPYLQQWYGAKMLSMAQNPHTKNVSPVDANAVGGLRLALSRQKA
jgi:hypothetical protein